MPLMYQQNTLQMEWCLNCHRDPGKNLRPTSEIYNMAWEGPTSQKPVWCGSAGLKDGVPTAQTVSCTTVDPSQGRRPGGLAQHAARRIARASRQRRAGHGDSSDFAICEADRPGIAGQIPDPAVPHPHAPGIEQLRDMPPMSETKGKKQELTLEAARAKLAGQTGKTYWRSVDELADTPAFRETVQREFPAQAAEWIDPVSRRGFLKVMGASLALAGLSGCTKQPDEPIYPYVKEPEDLVLGRPVYFATAMPFNTGAVPLLVKSDAYRPIKLDGNPDHPVNRGTSDPLTQGSLLDLYDPDRSQRVICRGEVREFAAFLAVFRAMLADKKASGGAGLYILSDTVTSPTLAAQWKAAQQSYPNAKWLQWDPINRDSAYSASKTAFGDYYDAQYRLQDADVIVSLDADFLSGITHPGFLRLAADYAGRRKLADASSHHEPAVRGRERAHHHRLQGRASAGAQSR